MKEAVESQQLYNVQGEFYVADDDFHNNLFNLFNSSSDLHCVAFGLDPGPRVTAQRPVSRTARHIEVGGVNYVMLRYGY